MTTGVPLPLGCSSATAGVPCDDLDICTSNSTCQLIPNPLFTLYQCKGEKSDALCTIPPGSPQFVLTLAINCSDFDSVLVKQLLVNGTTIDPNQISLSVDSQCLTGDPCFPGGVVTFTFVLLNNNGTVVDEGSGAFQELNQTIFGTSQGSTTTGNGVTTGTTTGSTDPCDTGVGGPGGKVPVINVNVIPFVPPAPQTSGTPVVAVKLDDESSSAEPFPLVLVLILVGACVCLVCVVVVLALWMKKRQRLGPVAMSDLEEDAVSLEDVTLLKNVEVREGLPWGRGMYAGVWQGTTPVNLKPVSIEGRSAAWEVAREIRVLVALNHPNCIGFLGLCSAERDQKESSSDSDGSGSDSSGVIQTRAVKEQFFYVTEATDFGPLDLVLRGRNKPTSSLGLLACALQIASGMAYIHKQLRLVHRNLSLACVMTGPASSSADIYYSVKVSGFEFCDLLCKDIDALYDASAVDIVQSTPGPDSPRKSPRGKKHEEVLELRQNQPDVRYTAPEAITRGRWSEASDVFSFGLVVWQLLAMGQDPVDAEGAPISQQERLVEIVAPGLGKLDGGAANDSVKGSVAASLKASRKSVTGSRRGSAQLTAGGPSGFASLASPKAGFAEATQAQDEFPALVWTMARSCLDADPNARPDSFALLARQIAELLDSMVSGGLYCLGDESKKFVPGLQKKAKKDKKKPAPARTESFYMDSSQGERMPISRSDSFYLSGNSDDEENKRSSIYMTDDVSGFYSIDQSVDDDDDLYQTPRYNRTPAELDDGAESNYQTPDFGMSPMRRTESFYATADGSDSGATPALDRSESFYATMDGGAVNTPELGRSESFYETMDGGMVNTPELGNSESFYATVDTPDHPESPEMQESFYATVDDPPPNRSRAHSSSSSSSKGSKASKASRSSVNTSSLSLSSDNSGSDSSSSF
jgi:Protein tyrosine and serine/threonine kinase